MEGLNPSEYQKVYEQLTAVNRRDAKHYNWIGIALMVISFIGFYFVTVIGVIAMLVGAWFLYLSWKSRNKDDRMFLSTIRSKEHWVNPDNRDDQYRSFLLEVRSAFRLTRSGPKPLKSEGLPEFAKVNSDIYGRFNAGDHFLFILVPAGDLIAWGNGKQLNLVESTLVVEEQTETYPNGIPQVPRVERTYSLRIED